MYLSSPSSSRRSAFLPFKLFYPEWRGVFYSDGCHEPEDITIPGKRSMSWGLALRTILPNTTVSTIAQSHNIKARGYNRTSCWNERKPQAFQHTLSNMSCTRTSSDTHQIHSPFLKWKSIFMIWGVRWKSWWWSSASLFWLLDFFWKSFCLYSFNTVSLPLHVLVDSLLHVWTSPTKANWTYYT